MRWYYSGVRKSSIVDGWRHDPGRLEQFCACRKATNFIIRYAEPLTTRQTRCQVPLINDYRQNVSICRKPLILNGNTHTEAFVASGRDLVTFFLVGGDAADIRHEDTWFSRNVGADVP
jgi:hypothetical protein